ncbi:calcium-binding protein [Microvirga flavescens]|uniref:calcium-binding protein n=1 Tax=Microvirga flavescens TaxID=2249811 RepID=UPI000DD5EF4A|nr:calcium-binding protein [Microvirga flavescens]
MSNFKIDPAITISSDNYASSFQTVALTNGMLLVLWEKQIPNPVDPEAGDTNQIVGQIFNADGSASGPQFNITAETENCTTLVSARLQDGRVAVGWQNESTGYVQARILEADGTLTSAKPAFDVINSAGASLNPNGLISLQRGAGYMFLLSTAGGEVAVQFDNANNRVITSTAIGSKSSAAALPDGSYVVASLELDPTKGQFSIVVQKYNSAGNPSGSKLTLGTTEWEYNISLTTLPNGNVVAAWLDNLGFGNEIKAAIFNPGSGDVVVPAFTISPADGSMHAVSVNITALPESGFAFSFEKVTAGTPQTMWSVYSDLGDQVDGPTTVPTWNAGEEAAPPHLVIMNDGRYALDWLSYTDTPAGSLVSKHLQFIDPRNHGSIWKGKAVSEQYMGTDFADSLNGMAGDDTLFGAGGNDVLDGGSGNDRLVGGDGDDTYRIDSPADTIIDTSGIDTVESSISYALAANLENLTGSGWAALTLKGNDGANVIKGGDGNDKIYGGLGKDTLSGGAGKDIFVFNTKVDKTKKNVDAIVDYSVKDDTIWLENAIFKALGKKGTEKKPAKLSSNMFWVGTKAHDADDRIIYDNKKGILYYDADGTGHGAAVQITVLKNKPKLKYTELFII